MNSAPYVCTTLPAQLGLCFLLALSHYTELSLAEHDLLCLMLLLNFPRQQQRQTVLQELDGQLERSRQLQSEGLEGFPQRAGSLLTLGSTLFLRFLPAGNQTKLRTTH